jgi:hypothetical protein
MLEEMGVIPSKDYLGAQMGFRQNKMDYFQI